MPPQPLAMQGNWIWSDRATAAYNNFVAFRRRVEVAPAAKAARVLITADSRYELFINGVWVGHGPVRSWPAPWPVDEYDVAEHLVCGANVVAVLVQHFGLGNFQYLHAEPGLLGRLDWQDRQGAHQVLTDASWKAAPHAGFATNVPRISLQAGWEEQFDARTTFSVPADWRSPDFDDSAWPASDVLRPAGQPPHETFERRDIPMLTREVVEPVRVLAAEVVRPAPYTWSLNPRTVLNPDDRTANTIHGRLLLATHIHSEKAQAVQFHLPGCYWPSGWKLNGQMLKFDDHSLQVTDRGVAHGRLAAGWNVLMSRLPEITHTYSTALNIWTDEPVRFCAQPDHSCPPEHNWLSIGPFADVPSPQALKWVSQPTYVTAKTIEPSATGARFDEIWNRGTLTAADLAEAFVRPLPPETIAPTDVFALCASERVAKQAKPVIEEPAALQRDNADWTTVYPCVAGDTRLLLDFGRQVVGYHEFELDAPDGTVVDCHNFEFIQRDGRKNLAEGMNNSFRYICRDGLQRYRTFVRRGFRYSWVSLRSFSRPVRIRFVRVLMSTYPPAAQGDFACSDALLERIWHVGAHSVRCCSEDTYTDCPTYEQTLWVGDARNEALVDLVANGDPRLSARCWLVTARSLDRSPLAESHVPSAWSNILPAWTFLWMRWAQEHYLLTGDKTLAGEMLTFLDRNAKGIAGRINQAGLFDIRAWNMFDWAPMDTPDRGVVTHQNCLAVLGLRQTADLARRLGRKDLARRWTKLAETLARAVNKHLWDRKRRAYIDSIHADGVRSTVFSQQTQTAAYISGVASGARAGRCRQVMEKAPAGFVKAGSPFFMFFVLEGLVRQRRFAELVKTIRRYWGVQVEAGATTFWETYHPDQPRLTRSHCHGWSAAPTFFLSQYVLGVRAAEPGYAKVLVAPQPGGLNWAQGRVPTPHGVIECYWKAGRGGFMLDLTLPAGLPTRIELPATGKLEVQTGKARRLPGPGGVTVLTTTAARVRLRVKP